MIEGAQIVARLPELVRLERFLERTIAGNGQLCFIAGEAGTGKSALLAEFARRAQEADPELIVASGMCDAQTGIVDPYLPFREVLNLMMGSFDTKVSQGGLSDENARRLKAALVASAETLVEHGPDLIGLFVPGASLLARLGTTLAKKSEVTKRLEERLKRTPSLEAIGGGAIDQGQVFQQYINVLRALGKQRPLLIALDDLHWADDASINLLFRLGRRLEGGRLLVVGTYRPEEIAAGRDGARHPLEKVLSEFKRYHGDISIDLDITTAERGREFVETLLATEPNRFSRSFIDALVSHTAGHPLFTIELLRAMEDRGDIVRNAAGEWEERGAINWSSLPARAEGIFEERLARLEPRLRHQLSVGSVEGEQFRAEVVAKIEEMPVRDLVRHLSGELQKEHQLVLSLGSERIGRQRVSHYRFTHNLLQAYLYRCLDEVERSYLHEDVARALEELYGEHKNDIAVQLARHYEVAEMNDEAVYYLKLSGDRAAVAHANDEAVAFYTRALNLLEAGDDDGRFPLLVAREKVLGTLGQKDARQADLDELQLIVDRRDNAADKALIALRKTAFALENGLVAAALSLAKESAELAIAAGDRLAEARAEHRWGRAFWQANDYASARPHLEKALELAEAESSLLDEAQAHYDLAALALLLGDYKDGLAHLEEARGRYETLGHERGLIRCYNNFGIHYNRNQRQAEALTWYRKALDLAREIGWRFAEAYVHLGVGYTHYYLGQLDDAEAELRAVKVLAEEVGVAEVAAIAEDTLGLVYEARGDLAAAEAAFRRSLAAHREAGNARGQSYANTHLGHILRESGRFEAAAEAFGAALQMREESGETALMQDTRAGLALVALAQGDNKTAVSEIEDVVAWLATNGHSGLEYPVRVYLAAHNVLRASSDPAHSALAGEMLHAGHKYLMDTASNLEPGERERFLESQPYRRALLAAFEGAEKTTN